MRGRGEERGRRNRMEGEEEGKGVWGEGGSKVGERGEVGRMDAGEGKEWGREEGEGQGD